MKTFRNNSMDTHTRVHCCSGSRELPEYTSRYNDIGVLELVQTGVRNIYAEIQSHKDSCDINLILTRYAAGDSTALSRIQGVYADVTGMPKTYAELLNKVNDGKQIFEQLPLSVREKFGHDFGRFMVSIGTPEFFDALKDVLPDNSIPAKEVVSNESDS